MGIVLLAGCSTLGGRDDKNDICYSQRQSLRASENYYATSIITGAIMGGLGGAALGVVSSLAAGGDISRGAAIGGGVGAITGGLAAYYEAKQKNIADAQTLAVSIQGDILRENGEIDRASIAFANLRNCRFAAAERIKADYRAGRMPRATALDKLQDIKKNFDADIRIAEEIGGKMTENMRSFQYASERLLDGDPSARTVLARYHEAEAAEEVADAEKTTDDEAPSACNGRKKHQQSCGQRKSAKSSKKSHAGKSKKIRGKTHDRPASKPAEILAENGAAKTANAAETNRQKQGEYADKISKSKAESAALEDLDKAPVEGEATGIIMQCRWSEPVDGYEVRGPGEDMFLSGQWWPAFREMGINRGSVPG